ncbi:hypothetical protein [Bdellovibrio sp. HCB2-146]|uniref:hypothetical protein n=1 Tax=Bdellovibrio sp. HCB2-146 TaxID=3394362 RepID=UPI0039BCE712
MKNVTCYRLLILIFSGLVVLSGCKEPEVSLSELGKKMAAPQLKGTSPFDQDFNANNYVRIQGTCSVRVGDLSISFDNKTWYSIPSIPNYTGTTLAGSETNDLSCQGDGTFDFYLTEGDMTSWGIAADADVNYIYLRGSTIVGDTHTLTLKDPKLDGGTGNSGPATQVVLQKYWPDNFAGATQCEYFMASLRDANGNYAGAGKVVNFSIDKKVDSTVYSQIDAYLTMADCQAGTNAQNIFSIPASQNGIQVYYRFPDAPIDGVIYFRSSGVNLTTPTSSYTPVTLRDASGSRFWFSTHSFNRVASNMCTPINFNARFYNGNMVNLSGSDTITPVVSGTNASKLLFFADSSCTTSVTTISGYQANGQFYFKYVGSEVSTDNLAFTITHTLAGPSLGGGTFDDIPHKIEIDRSGNSTVTHIDLTGPMTVQRGYCTRMNLSAFNNKGTLTSSTATVTLTPSSAVSQLFASQSSCDTQTTPISAIAMTGSTTEVWYRTTGTPGSTQTVTLSSAGINTPARTFTIDDKPTSFALLINGNATSLSYPVSPACVAATIEVKLTDYIGGYYYANTLGYTITMSVTAPFEYTLYSDSSCSAGNEVVGNLGMSIGPGVSSTGVFNYWIKANSTPQQYNFQVFQTSTPPANVPYIGGVTYPVIPGP